MKRKHSLYMFAAKNAALHSRMQHQHGCVLVYNGKIVASGWNNPIELADMWSMHAEVNALRKVDKTILPKCKMYVVRIGSNIDTQNEHYTNYDSQNPDNCFKLSKPCDKCRMAIEAAGIKMVFYSLGNSSDTSVRLDINEFKPTKTKSLYSSMYCN